MPLSKTATERLKVADKDQLIWDLKLQGLSGYAIGKKLNIPGTTVRRRLKVVLDRKHAASLQMAEKYSVIQTQRLEHLLSETITRGGIAPIRLDPKTLAPQSNEDIAEGKPYVLKPIDPAMVNAARGIIDSLTKLHGLEKPLQIAPVNPDGTPLEPATFNVVALTATEAAQQYQAVLQQPEAIESD